jgi:RNA polymerase sigma-70 factor (ECF subfamily)
MRPRAVLRQTSLNSKEHALLLRARDGDAAAFQALLGPLVPSLRRLAFAFAGNWDEADDLAQEALVKAFRHLDSFEERSALSTWLYAVTRGVCRDWCRSRAVRRRAQEVSAGDSLVSHGSLQDEELAQRELAQELWSAIQTLEPEFRAVLVLFDVEGLSYGEIAEIEGLPIGTVRSRLSRARARIRRHLSASHPSLTPRGRRGTDGPRSSFPGVRHEQEA